MAIAIAQQVDRDEFFGMAGINGMSDRTYEPVSIGKGFQFREGNNAWIRSMRRLNFRDADELRTLAPEHVSEGNVIIPIEKVDEEGNYYLDETPQERFKAIIGDNSHKVYSIKSNKYKPVQHQYIAQALADVSDYTGIPVFGKMDDNGGNLNISAFFADPDCNIDLSAHRDQDEDPAMLGVRCWNSHNGTTGFGAEIIGVRWLCSNLCAFGDILGRVGWNHLQDGQDVVGRISDVVTRCMDRVPVLQDRIRDMSECVITIDEAECALWGISLNPYKVEAITRNLDGLNPEIDGDLTQYDLWNAVNAYTSYSASGGSYQSKSIELNNNARLLGDITPLIKKGDERRADYLKTISLEGAVVVGD